MPRHWIAGAGLHGYLFNTCNSYDSYSDAVESIADLHDLGRHRHAELRRNRGIELNLRRDGNEYIEITPCNCSTPEVHNDD